jgi:hypothetical protein
VNNFFITGELIMDVKEQTTQIPLTELSADFVVVGGGLAGLCAAVAAARNGAKTIIIQDRPMFGGNSSSEMRNWINGALGADAKETGLIEEILLENYYYNPTLKYTIWDDVLFSFAYREPNLKILLNCSVNDLETSGAAIKSITAWHLAEQKRIRVSGKFFADCSGDSVLRYSGAEYRWGREARDEFNESHAPEVADKKTMGNSILIQTRRVKKHRPFRAPAWAYHFTDATAPKRNLKPFGDNFWWLEFGGVKNTITDADLIIEELLKIAYGSWEYIKNHPDGRGAEWELDWIGSLPGKRENVRYVGDHVISQSEIEAGGPFADAVCHGGWFMDEHHPEAFYFPGPPNFYYSNPSPYNIPYRALYSRNIANLFFAGRNISATHIAMSSTRVMATTATMGQAVGTAAALALRHNSSPRGVYENHLHELQQTLLRQDQLIPRCWREISALSSPARSSVNYEILRNGVDRILRWGDECGVNLLGENYAEYTFARAEKVSGARLIFDSDLNDSKRLRCREEDEDYRAMPARLAKKFRLLAQVNGAWQEVGAVAENIKRYVELSWAPISATGLRLVIDESWGGADNPARVFAFEAL